MQIATADLTITPENKQKVYDLTPADALILHALHFKEAKGAPLSNIVITGEAKTEVTPAVPATPAEYTVDHVFVRSAQSGKPATYRPRTDAEERALLQKYYTGNIEGKPAFASIFPDRTRPLPKTFEEIAEFIGNPTIATAEAQQEPAPEGKLAEAPETDALRQDGPTIEEFVKAGYNPSNYPPTGYAEKSTPREIALAIVDFEKQASAVKAGSDAAPVMPSEEQTAGEGEQVAEQPAPAKKRR